MPDIRDIGTKETDLGFRIQRYVLVRLTDGHGLG